MTLCVTPAPVAPATAGAASPFPFPAAAAAGCVPARFRFEPAAGGRAVSASRARRFTRRSARSSDRGATSSGAPAAEAEPGCGEVV